MSLIYKILLKSIQKTNVSVKRKICHIGSIAFVSLLFNYSYNHIIYIHCNVNEKKPPSGPPFCTINR